VASTEVKKDRTCVQALGLEVGAGRLGVIAGDVIWPAQLAEPGWIVDLSARFTPEIPRANLSYQDFRDWQAMNTVFSSLDVYRQHVAVLDREVDVHRADRDAAAAARNARKSYVERDKKLPPTMTLPGGIPGVVVAPPIVIPWA